ncbi:MAG: hypothetical protein WC886_08165 [Saccharofermentanaceae bacterium]
MKRELGIARCGLACCLCSLYVPHSNHYRSEPFATSAGDYADF